MLAAICVIFCMSCVWDGEVFFLLEKNGQIMCIYVCIYIYVSAIEKVKKFKDSKIDDIGNLLLKAMNGILWRKKHQLVAV